MNDIEILEKLVIYWNSLINYAETDNKGVVYKWINTEGIVEKRDALKNLINRVKELEEDKRITELTKISCCTAQNCEALNNAIREGIANNKLRERIEELEEIEEEHRKENGKLQEKIKEYEKILEAYNVISTDYMPKDNKIIIADREYFNNGILKETCLPKSKIKEKIEEVKNSKENYTFEKLTSEDIRRTIITNLQELLED